MKRPTIIGSSTVSAGSSLFAEISVQLAALPKITLAFAIVGVLVASLRMAMMPDDDAAAKSMVTIRRILTIVIFLSLLGDMVFFLCGAAGVTPAGLSIISQILGMN